MPSLTAEDASVGRLPSPEPQAQQLLQGPGFAAAGDGRWAATPRGDGRFQGHLSGCYTDLSDFKCKDAWILLCTDLCWVLIIEGFV